MAMRYYIESAATPGLKFQILGVDATSACSLLGLTGRILTCELSEKYLQKHNYRIVDESDRRLSVQQLIQASSSGINNSPPERPKTAEELYKKPTPSDTQIEGVESFNGKLVVVTSPAYPGLCGLGACAGEPKAWASKLAKSGAKFDVEFYVTLEAVNEVVAEKLAYHTPTSGVVQMPELERLANVMFFYAPLRDMAMRLEHVVTEVDCGRILYIGGRKKELFNATRVDRCNQQRTEKAATYSRWDTEVTASKSELQQLVRDLAPKIARHIGAGAPPDSGTTTFAKKTLLLASILTGPIGFAGLALLDKLDASSAEKLEQVIRQLKARLTQHERSQIQRIAELLSKLTTLGIHQFVELNLGNEPGSELLVTRDSNQRHQPGRLLR